MELVELEWINSEIEPITIEISFWLRLFWICHDLNYLLRIIFIVVIVIFIFRYYKTKKIMIKSKVAIIILVIFLLLFVASNLYEIIYRMNNAVDVVFSYDLSIFN